MGSVNAVHGLPHTVGDDAGSGTDKHGDAAHDGGLHSQRRSGSLRITSQLDVSTQQQRQERGHSQQLRQ